MSDHVLDANLAESSYFAKLNKNGKAAYRHAVYELTGGLPLWAMGVRTVVTQTSKVVTLKVVTVTDAEAERAVPGYVDPLTLIDA